MVAFKPAIEMDRRGYKPLHTGGIHLAAVWSYFSQLREYRCLR